MSSAQITGIGHRGVACLARSFPRPVLLRSFRCFRGEHARRQCTAFTGTLALPLHPRNQRLFYVQSVLCAVF